MDFVALHIYCMYVLGFENFIYPLKQSYYQRKQVFYLNILPVLQLSAAKVKLPAVWLVFFSGSTWCTLTTCSD